MNSNIIAAKRFKKSIEIHENPCGPESSIDQTDVQGDLCWIWWRNLMMRLDRGIVAQAHSVDNRRIRGNLSSLSRWYALLSFFFVDVLARFGVLIHVSCERGKGRSVHRETIASLTSIIAKRGSIGSLDRRNQVSLELGSVDQGPRKMKTKNRSLLSRMCKCYGKKSSRSRMQQIEDDSVSLTPSAQVIFEFE